MTGNPAQIPLPVFKCTGKQSGIFISGLVKFRLLCASDIARFRRLGKRPFGNSQLTGKFRAELYFKYLVLSCIRIVWIIHSPTDLMGLPVPLVSVGGGRSGKNHLYLMLREAERMRSTKDGATND
jgi:hypothetical protein